MKTLFARLLPGSALLLATACGDSDAQTRSTPSPGPGASTGGVRVEGTGGAGGGGAGGAMLGAGASGIGATGTGASATGAGGASSGGRNTGGLTGGGGMTGQQTGGLGGSADPDAGADAGAGGQGAGGLAAGGAGGMPPGDAGSATGGMGTGGALQCDTSPPPSSVAAWIDESWDAEGANNVLNRSAWLFDAAMKGEGEIRICVRWGATQTATSQLRDQIAPAMEQWFNEWFSVLYPYDCFPHEHVRVRLAGWAVRPGQESLIGWSDDSVPIYTEQENGSDPPGEPKCPDACGFFFNWDHDFSDCPGGEANHFDYSLWLDDALPGGGGAAAVGGDWGLRMPVSGFLNALGNPNSNVILHEMGHGFGLSDYYSWTGSRPEGGSIMIVGSAFGGGPTLGDQWILRRYWSEARADRYR